MTKRTYGHTTSGKPIDDDLIEDLADEAEAGYDVDEVIARRGKRGSPRLGHADATARGVAAVDTSGCCSGLAESIPFGAPHGVRRRRGGAERVPGSCAGTTSRHGCCERFGFGGPSELLAKGAL